MIRSFLSRDIAGVSASSFRLHQSAAEIYYPAFYMSLLLTGNLNEAAAEGRLALRKDRRRVKRESRERELRDDHFVHWNWSNSRDLHKSDPMEMPGSLIYRMLWEAVPRCLSLALEYLSPKRLIFGSPHPCYHRFWSLHHNFDNIQLHVRCAKALDVPSILLRVLEIEHNLTKDDKHAVYLSPYVSKKRGNEGRGYKNEQNNVEKLIRNMARIWIRTNFVAYVRFLSVERMLAEENMSEPVLWQQLANKLYGDTDPDTFEREEMDKHRKFPKVRRMLVIEGFELLVPPKGKAMSSQQDTVLNRIVQVAREMRAADWTDSGRTDVDQDWIDKNIPDNEFYLITSGALLNTDDWELLDLDPKILGRKWTGGTKMNLLPFDPDVELSTYKKRKKSWLDQAHEDALRHERREEEDRNQEMEYQREREARTNQTIQENGT
jgi:hypothetical protein